MSSRRRDRHGRGLRGPLALPGPLTRHPARPPHPAGPAEAFAEAVQQAVERVARHAPELVGELSFGIEDVPDVDHLGAGVEVPLALAVGPSGGEPGRLVVYRRPLEHRASTRRGLRVLVHRTVVEQLAALSGRSVDELDPDGESEDD